MKIFFAVLVTGVLFFSACNKSVQYKNFVMDGFTQGTTYHIVVRDSINRDIQPAIDSIFKDIEKSMSLFDKNSLINRINNNTTDSLDTYIKECIDVAAGISRQSDGMYDITIKPLTAAYGFTGGNATLILNIDSLLQYVGYNKISIENNRIVKARPEIQIDLNSIAQGYTVDVVARYIEEELGIDNYIVEMGGEIFAKGNNGTRDWVVGIDQPMEDNITPGEQLQVKINLSARGLATSGNYRKFYTDKSGKKIVHTVNPKTGDPVISNLLSATVVAGNATLADAYGTFFMVAGLEASKKFLAEHPEIDGYLIYSDENNKLQTFSTNGLKIVE